MGYFIECFEFVAGLDYPNSLNEAAIFYIDLILDC